VKRIALGFICLLIAGTLHTGSARADAFAQYGLRPVALVIDTDDTATYLAVMKRAERLGGRGLLGLAPTLVFGRFPDPVGLSDFADLPVSFSEHADEIDPMSTDLVTLRSARALLEKDAFIRQARDLVPTEPFVDRVLRVPQEEIDSAVYRGPLTGSPALLEDRAIDQNSEFMIGTVLINLILPESNGGSEDWTDDEIADCVRDVQLGLEQYTNAANWVDLSFTVNCPPLHRRVPVDREPIEGDWDYDPIWIAQALGYLGVDQSYARMMSHQYNNETRARFGTDWVYTAFVVDASANECWQGPAGQYVAYSYLGGPYEVAPYPACRFGDGIHFGHVFIHEMSHGFWALDEYASAEASCSARAGYLNYVNGNSYYMGCGEGLDCIMNNATLSEPLPICMYTMGQVGLADDNSNSVPDLYEVYPEINFVESPFVGDTTFNGEYTVSARFHNGAVTSKNYAIPADRRISYAPRLVKGWMQINNGLWEELEASENWDSPDEQIGMIMSEGLEPGENWIRFRVENMVGLRAEAEKRFIYVGIKYYENTAIVDPGRIELRWKTAHEIFGADFDVHREDLTAGTPDEILAVLDGDDPDEVGTDRNIYRYFDETVEAGHEYVYHIVGRLTANSGGVMQEFSYPSRDMDEIASIPVPTGLVSVLMPNPMDQSGTKFSVRVPKSFNDPTYSRDSGSIMRSPAAVEKKTAVEVDVFDVAGRKVRTIYSLSLYGGDELTLEWDGADDHGTPVATGVYFIRVTAGTQQEVKKVVLMR
jgi:hypothetical protein